MLGGADVVAFPIHRHRKVFRWLLISGNDIIIPSRRFGLNAAGTRRNVPIGAALALGVRQEDIPKPLSTAGRLAGSSSYLEGSSGEDLPVGVEVFLVLEESREKTVDVMVIVPGPEDVDDSGREFIQGSCSHTGCFNSIEGTGVYLVTDRVSFSLSSGRAVLQSFQLLMRFAEPFLERGAPQRGSGAEVGSKVSKVFHHVDALLEMVPHGILKPVGKLYITGKIEAFVWCDLRTHGLQVKVGAVQAVDEVVNEFVSI